MKTIFPSLTRAFALAMALPLAAAGAHPAKAKSHAPQHPINLNSASVTELMQLPKVGLKTAERIVSFRKEHGGFRRPEELMNVKGIGEKSYVKLQPYLRVEGAAAAILPVSQAKDAKGTRPKHAAAPRPAVRK